MTELYKQDQMDNKNINESNWEDSLNKAKWSIDLLTQDCVPLDRLREEGYQIEGVRDSRARKDFGKYIVVYMKPVDKDYYQLRVIARRENG